MKPILFNIFGLKVYGYGTMIAIGIITAILLVSHRAKRQGYDEDKIINMSIIAVIAGLLGGKLLYIITEARTYIEEPKNLLDIGSGFVIYGAIIAGALAVYLYSKRNGWDVLKVMDMAIPAIPLAQGFGRIGCFLAGCCYGRPTIMSIGVVFKESLLAPNGIHLHPTQIYSAIFDFVLAIFLLYFSKKERNRGRIFSLYVIIYSIGRFVVEYFRDDPRGNVAVFSTSQFISILMLIIGIVILNKKQQEEVKEDQKEESEE